MFDKILIPLDGSGLAEVALPYAEELAARLGSEITILHVCDPLEAQYRHMHEFYLQKIVEVTKHNIESYHQGTHKQAVKVNLLTLTEHPAEQIVDYAEKENVSLIVMATHGKSGLKRWILGSVAEKVLRSTKQPIALIRAKDDHPDVREKGLLKKVLVPLDGSKESELVIPYVEEFASKIGVEVILLHVIVEMYPSFFYDPSGYVPVAYNEETVSGLKMKAELYLADIGSALSKKGISTRSEVVLITYGPIAQEIIRLADKTNADIVAMTKKSLSAFRTRFFGSTTEEVLQEVNTPLLLVTAQRDNKE
jgi:nucleotide-binding universal stress UspA family protein